MGLQILHLSLVHVQEELHALGKVIHAGKAAVTIGKDFICTVITRDDNEALVGVDDVVSRQGDIA